MATKAVQPWEGGREGKVLKNVNTWGAALELKKKKKRVKTRPALFFEVKRNWSGYLF